MDQRRGVLREDDIVDGDGDRSMVSQPIGVWRSDDGESDEGRRARDARWRRFDAIPAAHASSHAPTRALAKDSASIAEPIGASASALAFETGGASRAARAPTQGAWRLRLEGAALATLAALALAASGAMDAGSPWQTAGPAATVAIATTDSATLDSATLDPATPDAPMSASAALERQSLAQPDAGGLAALSDSAIIAWISSAEPPFRVVLHLAPDANPREVARLETAVRAWGFAPPELRPAREPLVLPEVAFHHEADRAAALLLARIADGILPIAVLTPPEAGDGDAAAAPPPGTLELMVVAR